MHPNCHCSVCGYLDEASYNEWLDSYKEHGLSYKEWREQRNDVIIEMYRKGSTHRKVSSSGKEIIDEATYHKITNPAIKAGADIRIGEGEYLEHIRKYGTAVTLGDVIYFTPEKTVSDVLEEIHHFYQNKRGLNNQYNQKQRMILNEIDAKEYLLSVTDKYRIPLEEVEETKQHLEYYRKQMQEMKERGEWND